MKKSLLLLLFSASLLGSCKKEEEKIDTKTALLKTWQAERVQGNTGAASGITAVDVFLRGGANNIVDFSNFYVTYKGDGTFERTEIANTSQITKGTWTLAADNKTLTMVSGDGAGLLTYLVESVENNSAKFKYMINFKTPGTLDTRIVQEAKAKGLTLTEGSFLLFDVVPK